MQKREKSLSQPIFKIFKTIRKGTANNNKTLILIILVFLLGQVINIGFNAVLPNVRAAGNSLYVSIDGNDANNGTLTSPFKSVQKCADVAQTSYTCVIKAGTYRETVVPANSGVTFTNYGNDKVTISGTEIIQSSNFGSYSGNIYKATLPWSLNIRHAYDQTTNNQVFVDGKMMVDARWPNISANDVTSITNIAGKRQDNARADSAQITSSTAAQYSDSDLASAGTFWGSGTNKGKISFNPGYGIMATTCDILSKNSNSVGFQCNPDPGQGDTPRQIDAQADQMSSPKSNNYYYLWGNLNALDSPGEFFVDPPTINTGNMIYDKGNYRSDGNFNLYLQLPNNANPAANHVVEVRKRMYGFDLSNRTDTTIKGLSFFASTIKTDEHSNSNKLENFDMKYLWHTEEAPPLSYESGTVGLALRGSNNILKDSNIAYSSGTLISLDPSYQRNNSGNQVINNVIHDSSYSGFGKSIAGNSSDANHKHVVSHNTIYNAGRFLVQADSGLDIIYNDAYNSHLQISDLGAIYGWGTDGKHANIAYNLVHDAWAEANIPDSQFGAHGIYLDDETTSFNIYRNTVWGINGEGIMLAGYRPWSQDYNPVKTDNDRLVYNNTVDGVLGLLNKCENNQCGFQTGTHIKNNIFTKQQNEPSLETKYGSLDLATNYYDDALFVSKNTHNYSLQSYSPAIDSGSTLPPYTDGFVNAPDIGAIESGKPIPVAGATIRTDDIANLTNSCISYSTTATCTFDNLSEGRKMPDNMKVQIGNSTMSGECSNSTNYTTNLTITICKNISLNNQQGGQLNTLPLSIAFGNSPALSIGQAHFDTLAVSQVLPNSGSTDGGTNLDITGTGFSQNDGPKYFRTITVQNPTNQKLYNYQILITLDTQALISAGKMKSDCGDIRFDNGTKTSDSLDYWIESGCNTQGTKIWLKSAYLPNNSSSTLRVTYGQPELNSASNGHNTFNWFEDFSSTPNSAITFDAHPTSDITVGIQNGEMKIAGTNNQNNQYNFWGFNLEKTNLPALSNFTIDSELEIKQGTHFLANVGGSDNTMSLFDSSSGTSATKNIAYYNSNTGWNVIGSSTVADQPTIPKTTFSIGLYGPNSSRNVQWKEQSNTQTVQAIRTGLNNPDYGSFTFRPGQIGSFDARFDNVRLRQLTSNGQEPTTTISTESTSPTIQIQVAGQVCTNPQFLSPTHLSCITPPHSTGQVPIKIINPDGGQIILDNTFNYVAPIPPEVHRFGSPLSSLFRV